MLLHARIQEFSSGGVQVSLTQKSSDNVFFFFFFFFFKSSAYFTEVKWSNGQFQRNLSFFKVPEGVQHFPGGSNFFQGGSNCLFPIETHITCDFPGGSGPPVPPSGSTLVLVIATLLPHPFQNIVMHLPWKNSNYSNN